MRTLGILIALGIFGMAGGVGTHYVFDRAGFVQRTDGLASAVDTLTSPTGAIHCGESKMSKSGELSNQEAFNCFSGHLLNCSPADFVASVEGGNIRYLRTIMQRQGDRCMVRESYLSIGQTDLVGKSMLCAYNPMLPLDQVINYRNCTGELRDELFNQLP